MQYIYVYLLLVNIMVLMYYQLVLPFDSWALYCCMDAAPLLPLYGTGAEAGIRVHSEAWRTNDTISILAQIFVQM